jgi:plasmid stabilization system protein ParE
VKHYDVVYTPEAQDQLENILMFVAEASGSVDVAAQFVGTIVDYCEGLDMFPVRGNARDDIRAGLRTTNFRGNVVVAFTVNEGLGRVEIIGIFYGGQDYASHL